MEGIGTKAADTVQKMMTTPLEMEVRAELNADEQCPHEMKSLKMREVETMEESRDSAGALKGPNFNVIQASDEGNHKDGKWVFCSCNGGLFDETDSDKFGPTNVDLEVVGEGCSSLSKPTRPDEKKSITAGNDCSHITYTCAYPWRHQLYKQDEGSEDTFRDSGVERNVELGHIDGCSTASSNETHSKLRNDCDCDACANVPAPTTTSHEKGKQKFTGGFEEINRPRYGLFYVSGFCSKFNMDILSGHIALPMSKALFHNSKHYGYRSSVSHKMRATTDGSKSERYSIEEREKMEKGKFVDGRGLAENGTTDEAGMMFGQQMTEKENQANDVCRRPKTCSVDPPRDGIITFAEALRLAYDSNLDERKNFNTAAGGPTLEESSCVPDVDPPKYNELLDGCHHSTDRKDRNGNPREQDGTSRRYHGVDIPITVAEKNAKNLRHGPKFPNAGFTDSVGEKQASGLQQFNIPSKIYPDLPMKTQETVNRIRVRVIPPYDEKAMRIESPDAAEVRSTKSEPVMKTKSDFSPTWLKSRNQRDINFGSRTRKMKVHRFEQDRDSFDSSTMEIEVQVTRRFATMLVGVGSVFIGIGILVMENDITGVSAMFWLMLTMFSFFFAFVYYGVILIFDKLMEN